jgi:uncharacterized cupredoxin-like copper-binding protein
MCSKLLAAIAISFVQVATVLAAASAVPATGADWSQVRVVTVIASEYQFSPAKLTFRRGVSYRLHLENHGKETHEFTAPKFFKAIELSDSAVLNADKTEIVIHPSEAKDLTFVPKEAGHFGLRCSDHDWAGMTGTITVK